MNDDWAHYFCLVDNSSASMFLNMDLAARAPREELQHMGFISLTMLEPYEDGLASQAESETLYAIEDALKSALETEGKTLYVGRCTTEGARDFIYYMHDPTGWSERVEAALAPFPAYQWQAGTQPEKEWDTYFELLYPDDPGLNDICNSRVRIQLEESGDIPSIPRMIDHWLYFHQEADRLAFISEAETEGFAASNADPVHDAPLPGDAPLYEVVLQREDAPENINEITWGLRELAGARGGYYDGWGTTVMTEEEKREEES